MTDTSINGFGRGDRGVQLYECPSGFRGEGLIVYRAGNGAGILFLLQGQLYHHGRQGDGVRGRA